MQPSRSGVTTTTPVPLHWVRYGPAGAPQLLVLHGGPGAHHDYLLPQMLQLAESHELIFYDQRGGGRSRTADHTPITWRTHVHDLALLAREMELAPLTLVGYSWGGLLAMLYAADVFGGGDPPLPPGSLSPVRMILIDPAPVTWEARRAFESELARRQNDAPIRSMREDLAASGLRERDPEAYRQRAFELSVAGYFAHPERARELTPFRVMGRVQQSVWESLGQFDLRSDLSRISCPTLIIHGQEDPIPLSASEAAAHTIPNAKLVVLDDSGHVPYVEAPDALFGAIDIFLQETASAVLPPTRP